MFKLLSAYIEFALITIVWLCAFSSYSTQSDSRPNIILINADDLGAHHVGVYGQKVIKTPRIDQMAQEGVLFKNGYSSATTCGPSRVALLLGKHLGHLPGPQRKNGGLCRVYQDQVAFPELLRDNGYHTAMFGKHHNVRQSADYTPIGDLPSDSGFDLSIGTFWAMAAHQLYLDGVTAPQQNYPKHLWKDDHGSITRYPLSPDRYTHNEYVDLALDYIEEDKDAPFFLYLPFQIPHWEIAVPRKGDPDFGSEDTGLLEQYLNEDGSSIFKETPFQGNALFQRKISEPAATHAAMISRLDRDVGLILDKLIEKGLDENTLVVFTSDNGRVGTPGGDHFDMNRLIKGAKASLYEGGIKVPFIFWGGKTQKNHIIEEPIIMHDLATTFLSMAGIDSTYDSDGRNWKEALFGQEGSGLPTSPRPLYWENFHGHGCQAVLLENRYKVIKSTCDRPDYKIQVFDLSIDPRESNDLSSQSEMTPTIEKAKRLFVSEHIPFQGSGILF